MAANLESTYFVEAIEAKQYFRYVSGESSSMVAHARKDAIFATINEAREYCKKHINARFVLRVRSSECRYFEDIFIGVASVTHCAYHKGVEIS